MTKNVKTIWLVDNSRNILMLSKLQKNKHFEKSYYVPNSLIYSYYILILIF